MITLPLLITVCIGLAVVQGQGYNYRKLGEFAVRNPCFLKVVDYAIDGKTPRKTLFVTSFSGSPFTAGKVFYLDNLEQVTKDGAWSSAQLGAVAKSFKWPNFVEPVPTVVLPNAVSIADGFLVPLKGTGGVYLIETGQDGNTVINEVSPSKRGYFYHNITWMDMDGDGDLDVLTARATKPLFSAAHGEMIWFENEGKKTYPWKEHVITQGPDVLVTPLNHMADESEFLEIVATQFFTKKLVIYELDKKTLGVTASAIVDDTIGQVYDARYVDLDSDGVRELLVGNHEDNSQTRGIWVYQRPTTSGGSWSKTLISSNFTIREKGSNQGTPGFVYSFHPSPANAAKNERPHLLVAGDGSQEAYLLRPVGTGFGYKQETIVNLGGVIGALEISDIDGDGYVEFFVPDYDGSKVQVFTFAS